jgi:VWFA-related protein
VSLALLVVAAAATQAPPTTFPAAAESVYIDVFVTDKKGSVDGLIQSDFELRDNGVRQKVELVAVGSLPLTTLLVFDTSASVAGEKLDQLKVAGQALIRRMSPGDEIGLVAFGHEIQLLVPPTTEVARVKSALNALQAGGSTAVYDALYAAALLAPERGRALVVLFSDGEDNLSFLDLADLLRVLERSDVIVQAVGILPSALGSVPFSGNLTQTAGGDPAVAQNLFQANNLQMRGPDASVPPSEYLRALREIAEATGGRFWVATAPERLANAFETMVEAMKRRYVLRFEPEGVTREGRHTLTVTLARRSGNVHCRKAYFVGPERPPQPPKARGNAE